MKYNQSNYSDIVLFMQRETCIATKYVVYFLSNYKASACAIEEPLMGGVNPIPDSHMTASSFHSTNYQPHRGRFSESNYAWVPASSETSAPVPNMYIQVSFGPMKDYVN